MLSFFILGLILLTAMLWLLLERQESRRAASGKSRHSGLRILFAAMGILMVLFSGGCAAIFLLSGGSQFRDWLPVVALFSGLPLVAGLLISWLAMRRKPE